MCGENRSRCPFIWIVCAGVFLLCLFPAAVFLGGIALDHGTRSIIESLGSSWSLRVFQLWGQTLLLAILAAIFATAIGLACANSLKARPRRERFFWVVLQLLVLLPSPYVIIQGWLNLSGGSGVLLPSISSFFTIFSPIGLVIFASLVHSPLAFFVYLLADRAEDSKYREFDQIFSLAITDKVTTIWRKRYGWPTASSLSLCFLLTYWQYDAPSILRQNLLSLEIMAAFGSFFDHLQAAVLVVPTTLVGIPVAIGLSAILAEDRFSLRSPAAEPTRVHATAVVPLILVPAVTVFTAIVGLTTQLSDWSKALTAIETASADLLTTLNVGFSSGLLLAVASLVAAVAFRFILPKSRWLIVIPCLGFSIPPVVCGLGLSTLRTSSFGPLINLAPLVITNFFVSLPLMILTSICLTSTWTRSSTFETINLRIPFRVIAEKLVVPMILPMFPILFLIGFMLAVREVPASLLNYPPDGSTLALTIETMLHFDQPDAISALCLLQLIAVFFSASITLYGWYLLKRYFAWRQFGA